MSYALSRLQASGVSTRVERTIGVCLAQGVVKQVEVLSAELSDLEFAAFRAADADDKPDDAPVRKMAQGADPRIDEIKAELERLSDVMRENTGRLTLANTIPQGDWRRWADDHPARSEGRDENGFPLVDPYDIAVAAGYCHATALLDRLGDFVTEWEGEPLAPGQWEWLRENMHPGDLKAAARRVVEIYEGEGAKALPK